jgi:hypothetical protein
VEQSEKARRRDLARRYRAAQQEAARGRLGLLREDLLGLLAVLEVRLAGETCDHTLRLTDEWSRRHGKSTAAVAVGVRGLLRRRGPRQRRAGHLWLAGAMSRCWWEPQRPGGGGWSTRRPTATGISVSSARLYVATAV